MNFDRIVYPISPVRGPNCPPAQRLESSIAGESTSPELAFHLTACFECSRYVEALRSEQEAFLKRCPEEMFVRKLRRRASKSQRAWGLRLVAVVSVLAVFLLVPRIADKAATSIRFKGGSSFEVFYKRDGMSAPMPVSEDLQLRAGDVLRFSFAAETDGHLLILDLDGNGKVSAFFPFGEMRSVPLKYGSDRLLPGSVVLDETVGPEWLVAIFSAEPLDAESLSEQIAQHPRSVSKVGLRCGDCKIESLRVLKIP